MGVTVLYLTGILPSEPLNQVFLTAKVFLPSGVLIVVGIEVPLSHQGNAYLLHLSAIKIKRQFIAWIRHYLSHYLV